MTDDMHLAVLKQGVAAWNKWRAAHAAPGLRQRLHYPRDLFEIQVDKLNTYHITVPQVGGPYL
jgi:uncharacterized membrane protein (UPF0182 family)